jgi:hypothetical protein
MTTRTTMTRTIRLAIGAAAVLALIPPAAQARPALIGGAGPVVQKAQHVATPASPAGNVALAHQNGTLTVPMGRGGELSATRQVSIGKVDSGGFAWGAAAIGAGSVLAIGAIGAVGLATLRRRNVPLST